MPWSRRCRHRAAISCAAPERDRKEAKGIWPTGNAATDLVDVAKKCKGQNVSKTKADPITIIADKLKFPWARAELLVDVVFDCMEQSMSRGEKIEIRATRPNCPYTQAVHHGPIFAFTMVRNSHDRAAHKNLVLKRQSCSVLGLRRRWQAARLWTWAVRQTGFVCSMMTGRSAP